tara:strand:- start:5148 stop:7094 length:1947 start_codon:yes stop_codon:yes gene_type:complete
MCGIAGLLFNQEFNQEFVLRKMIDSLKHRGPDDCGVWLSEESSFGMAHSRLSIVDLSQSGHQPMHSRSQRYVIAFNGEIYNHLQIRMELESSGMSFNWRGHSDTETLLAGIELWGLPATLKKCVGMFAVSLWDRQNKELTLVRDRFGEKPLYYGMVGSNFVFASELSAFKVVPGFDLKIDQNALSLYLQYSAVPHPYSIYEGVSKLSPGCYVRFDENGKLIEASEYWALSRVIEESKCNYSGATYKESVEQFDVLMSETIKLQMQSDVPLGAFLSGGVDSSLIVAMMQKQSMRKVKTFSIGSDMSTYNEAQHAKEVACHLSTDHSELYVTDTDALDIIPDLASIYDEPFADASQIPTYLVSRMAKQHVSVVLSGDAGDELFGGYNRYTMTNSLWNKISKLPLFVRRFIATNIQRVSIDQWNRILSLLLSSNYVNPGFKIHKGAGVLASRTEEELYLGLLSRIKDPASWLIDQKLDIKNIDYLERSNLLLQDLSSIEKMMYYDTVSYLPWDILTKVDRASMAVSLETRVPFLDHRIAEFAWSLPIEYKVKGSTGKAILKDALYQYVPKELIERPKMGFGIPLSEWLRGPLRTWAEELLEEKRLSNEGLFNGKRVRYCWQQLLNNKGCWEHQIWNVLVFQDWYSKQQKSL